uniref:tRNA (guanine(26)-N(2))-dimethyltransferase n=1 Tax=Meloidogyne incognita TaxID=6306 RepID=A0A914N139_MELIC
MLESLKKENNFSFGTIKRLVGVLTLVLEELNDQPLFYEFEQLMRIIKCSSTPKNTLVRSALLNAGFKCSGSHCGPQALKTDAPTEFLWDICREWFVPVDFTLHKEAVPASKIENILRFQDNKGKNWGPKSKAKGSISSAKAGFGEEF